MPYSFSTKVDGAGNPVEAAHVNDLQTAISHTSGRIVVPAVDAGFSWYNQGGASSTTDANDNLVMTVPNGANILRGKTRPFSSSPSGGSPATVTMKATVEGSVGGNSYAGIILVSAADAAVVYGAINCFGGGPMRVDKWTNATTFSASYGERAKDSMFQWPMWIRMVDDGTNRKWYISEEGDYWELHTSQGRTDFLTPDRVGFVFRNETGSNGDMVVQSWEESGLV
jgi:hypothetical protein